MRAMGCIEVKNPEASKVKNEKHSPRPNKVFCLARSLQVRSSGSNNFSLLVEIESLKLPRRQPYSQALFSASPRRWKKDPGCGWLRAHPESGWQKNLLGGRADSVF